MISVVNKKREPYKQGLFFLVREIYMYCYEVKNRRFTIMDKKKVIIGSIAGLASAAVAATIAIVCRVVAKKKSANDEVVEEA